MWRAHLKFRAIDRPFGSGYGLRGKPCVVSALSDPQGEIERQGVITNYENPS